MIIVKETKDVTARLAAEVPKGVDDNNDESDDDSVDDNFGSTDNDGGSCDGEGGDDGCQVGGGSAPRSTELLPSNGGAAKEWFKLRNPRFGIKMIITIVTIITITATINIIAIITITVTINIITIIVTITTLRPVRRLQQTSCFVFQAVPLLRPSKTILDHSQWRHNDDEDEDDTIKWLI